MKEEFVTLETAKLLKEKGFNERTLFAYKNNGDLYQDPNRIESSYNSLPVPELCENFHTCVNFIPYNKCQIAIHLISAPNQSFAQKWLRETKDLHIGICYSHKLFWYYEIMSVSNHVLVGLANRPSIHYNTYEEALEAGIQEALKLI